jgi:hypothetical protein
LPKRTLFLVDDNGLGVASRSFAPPWKLKTVTWSSDDPPRCDEPGTFYQVRIGADKPGPRWMASHPQVVSTRGLSQKGKEHREVSDKIVRLLGGAREEDDDATLTRWLKQYAPVDALSRATALKIHRRLKKRAAA